MKYINEKKVIVGKFAVTFIDFSPSRYRYRESRSPASVLSFLLEPQRAARDSSRFGSPIVVRGHEITRRFCRTWTVTSQVSLKTASHCSWVPKVRLRFLARTTSQPSRPLGGHCRHSDCKPEQTTHHSFPKCHLSPS